jgi:hypothetical protein
MNQNATVIMLEQVAFHLGNLLDQVVFVGGAVTSLLITDPAATEVRFTQDIDVIVQVISRADYYQLMLRTLVPKLCLGMHGTTLRVVVCKANLVVSVSIRDAQRPWLPQTRFASQTATQSVATCIPKRSLGTRMRNNGVWERGCVTSVIN